MPGGGVAGFGGDGFTGDGVGVRGNGPDIDSTGTLPRAAAAPGAIGLGRVTCEGALGPCGDVGTRGSGPVGDRGTASVGTRGVGGGTAGRVCVVPAGLGTTG